MSNAVSNEMLLLTRVRTWTCALPVRHVVETLRALPVESVDDAPPFVRGLSMIRGLPTVVVDLGVLLGAGDDGDPGDRLVVLRVDERRVAVSVDDVLGIREAGAAQIQQLPPLLSSAGRVLVDAIGSLDSRLLLVLNAGRVLPAGVWESREAVETA